MVDPMADHPTPTVDELLEAMEPAERMQAEMFAQMVDQMPTEALEFLIAVLTAKRAERAD